MHGPPPRLIGGSSRGHGPGAFLLAGSGGVVTRNRIFLRYYLSDGSFHANSRFRSMRACRTAALWILLAANHAGDKRGLCGPGIVHFGYRASCRIDVISYFPVSFSHFPFDRLLISQRSLLRILVFYAFCLQLLLLQDVFSVINEQNGSKIIQPVNGTETVESPAEGKTESKLHALMGNVFLTTCIRTQISVPLLRGN